MESLRDRFGRSIDYMRISITDRCNLRCCYCMPEKISFVPMEQILTYEEIELICQAAAEIGIRKLKITGGEPLVRKGCSELIGKLKRISGIEQVTLTTNGVLLSQYLPELLKNGLDGVNISLDTLDADIYRQITGKDVWQTVWTGLCQAIDTGLRVKINCVLQKGKNDKDWIKLVEVTKRLAVDVRFIELMPIGYGKEYKLVFYEELLERLRERYPKLQEDKRVHGNGPAVYYQIPEAKGSVGFISAIHGKFCENCNRIRLTAQGELKPCLCFENSIDLKKIVREYDAIQRKEQIRRALLQAVLEKPRQHCFEAWDAVTEAKQMVQIGG